MTDLDIVIRLLVATVLGGVIGLEREINNQPAGLRTHIIVCLGSALIMIVSIEMAKASATVDPTRIAAQVVTGIGFLGAGAILRFGISVRGLTTAACLWTVAGIGLAAGAAMWLPATLVTFISFFTLYLLEKLEKRIIIGRIYKKVFVTAKDVKGIIGSVEKVLHDSDITIHNLGLNKLIVEHKVQLNALVTIPEKADLDKISKDMSAIDGVEQFEIE
ncbi:MAG: MgtC/SapB family protein [Planctomycetes bacterium]|nr:MgtC/SapB family protein [Planctomycetota bacterium]